MTVYELIRRLSEYPADWEVEYESDEVLPKDDGEMVSNAVHGVMPKPFKEVPAPNVVVIW